MKKLVSMLLVASLLLVLVSCGDGGKTGGSDTTNASAAGQSNAAEEPKFTGSFYMGTGSATGNYYSFGSALTSVVNRVTGANITVNSTGGSTENARLLGTKDQEFALIQSDVFNYAQTGTELFEGTPITNFKAITACYPEMVQIVVRKDANINTVTDLAGKNVCVGAVGSGYEVAARQILSAYNMSYDDINETFADQATAKNGIQDGTFDAMFLCSGYPNGNVTELSLTGKIELLSIDQEHLDILLKNYPFYATFTTETDEYNLGHSVTSVAVKCMVVCLDSFSDDEVYALTKSIYENLGDIREINGKANYMKLESALDGIPSNLHPGARKYYEEKGIKIPDHLK
ncbi:MAG: TAXI family TRAP transporter solute-binding subunit [Bacillota bacterium]|nr:TAXI family TRAP transporter solute-binding subunit [Bacillota bacterium]